MSEHTCYQDHALIVSKEIPDSKPFSMTNVSQNVGRWVCSTRPLTHLFPLTSLFTPPPPYNIAICSVATISPFSLLTRPRFLPRPLLVNRPNQPFTLPLTIPSPFTFLPRWERFRGGGRARKNCLDSRWCDWSVASLAAVRCRVQFLILSLHVCPCPLPLVVSHHCVWRLCGCGA